MSQYTRLSPTHIAQHEHDEDSNAKRVTMVNTDIAIELDAGDGDSVEMRAMEMRATPALNEEVNISKMARASVWVEGGTGSYSIEVGVGAAWMTVGSVSSGEGAVVPVCGDKLKVSGAQGASITVIGRGI